MSDQLPTATGGFGDKPQISFPTPNAPEGLKVQVLEQGTGDAVEVGQTIVVNYLGQSWGGSVFDNSWDRGQTISFPIGVGTVIGGWDEALPGQLIGSRVLISIPPELGYGPRGVPQAGIGPNATLVFVIDIVGVE